MGEFFSLGYLNVTQFICHPVERRSILMRAILSSYIVIHICSLKVLRCAFSVFIGNAKIILRSSVTLFGGQTPPLDGLIKIFTNAVT